MKLSMSMIEHYLSGGDTESIIQDDSRTIRGMRFISEQQSAYSRDYVYIGQAADFFEDPRYADALILASERGHIVCRGSEYEDLLNEVLAAFDFYSEAEQRLLNAAGRHERLADMLAVVAELLDEPFVVFGIDGSVLASINEEQIAEPGLRENIAVRKSLGAGGIGGYFVDDEGVVHRDLGREPLTMRDTSGMAAVSLYLYREEEPVGFAMCFPRAQSGILLAQALEPVFAPYLAKAEEFTSALSPHQSQHLALAELIGGAQVAQESIDRLGHAVGDASSICLITVESRAIKNRTQRMLLIGEIEASGIPVVACEVDDVAVFAVSEARVDELLRQISERFDAKSLDAGVSMPLAGFEFVQSAFRQAEFARASAQEPGVRHCGELALPFLLGVLRDDPVAEDMVHPALGALAAYDRAHGAALSETLRTYVENGCNQVEAAKQLYVHLNTLKYRLKRISELTGIDFGDRDALFHIELSYRIE